MINVSFRNADGEAGEVQFCAPPVPGVGYRLAEPQGDYVSTFAKRAGHAGEKKMSCNCILDFLYGGLEGHSTGGFTGPVTFGEIAYVLLNQTLVKLDVPAWTGSPAAGPAIAMMGQAM